MDSFTRAKKENTCNQEFTIILTKEEKKNIVSNEIHKTPSLPSHFVTFFSLKTGGKQITASKAKAKRSQILFAVDTLESKKAYP